MQANSFGKIAVPTPGTPVRVSTNTDLRVKRMRFAVVIGETGRVFLGVAGMNKLNGTGVVKEFWPTGAGGGVADAFEIWAVDDRHLLAPSDYYVDANNAGEGLIVAHWLR
jgi:hypothetical protein